MSYNANSTKIDFDLQLQMTYSSQSASTNPNPHSAATQGDGAAGRQLRNIQSPGQADSYYGGASNATSRPAHEIPQYERLPQNQVQYPDTSRPWGSDGTNTYQETRQPYGSVPHRPYDPSGGVSGPWHSTTTAYASSTTWYTEADSRAHGLLPGQMSAYDAAVQQPATASRAWGDNGLSSSAPPPPPYEAATYQQPLGRTWDQQAATGYWETGKKSG